MRSLNSPAAVMTEFFQGRNAATIDWEGFEKAGMSESEDLPANEHGSYWRKASQGMRALYVVAVISLLYSKVLIL